MSNITKKILKLAISKKSVFTADELALAWKITNKNVLRVMINRSIKSNILKKIRRGIYSLNEKDVNVFELACKLKKRSYISFETVLSKAGIIFQWQDKIFLASNRTSEIKNKYGKFVYRKIPDKALHSNDGIISKGNYFIATEERALCDKVYKDGISYFDDLSGIDRKKILPIAKLYNKRLEKDIRKII
ncbi:hypothetical protein KKH38_00780 [Patescibacteria group bacterium]|nr:hypothetical protein [Patescibacteria group bacterium]MBU4601123.1 hypothetical protein [Patescibacteria group bacterium]MCG2698213.1 hypothetical protein [Candidatus Parcubacteria bacterium]